MMKIHQSHKMTKAAAEVLRNSVGRAKLPNLGGTVIRKSSFSLALSSLCVRVCVRVFLSVFLFLCRIQSFFSSSSES